MKLSVAAARDIAAALNEAADAAMGTGDFEFEFEPVRENHPNAGWSRLAKAIEASVDE